MLELALAERAVRVLGEEGSIEHRGAGAAGAGPATAAIGGAAAHAVSIESRGNTAEYRESRVFMARRTRPPARAYTGG